MTDTQLLAEFARTQSSDAFATLVRRHVDLVYGTARRMVGDVHLAQDVTQAAFIVLAKKAKSINAATLPGWLVNATRLAAQQAMRSQFRRDKHETRVAQMRSEIQSPPDEPTAEELAPLLDEALARLNETDRTAVVTRFLQGRSFAEVGAAMGISEEAARKRVARAVDKLRVIFIKQGLLPSVGGLMLVLAAQQAVHAPVALAGTISTAATAGGACMGAALAKGVVSAMKLAQIKLAALLILGGSVVGGVTYGTITHIVAAQAVQPYNPVVAKPPMVLPVATPVMPSVPVTPAPSMVFDELYEKAPGSGPGLSMKIGPNTFAVATVVRYGADGKPQATDGRGQLLDPAALSLANIQPPADASKDIVVVFLQPGRDRYDIDRLRVFDHLTRRYIRDVVVNQVPGLSALRIAASPGTLPPQIDLWLDVASYDAANLPVNLPAKKDATLVIGGAAVGFDDIRDGCWNFADGKFTTVNRDFPQTTLRFNATGKWNAGRYQISAVSKSGQKYLSDFFIDLSMDAEPIFFFPFALEQTDHFELRPLAHEPPFFFDGVALPAVGQLPVAPSEIPQPVIVNAGTQSRVELPCGAVVELAGIGYYPLTDKGWWGVDGLPVALRNFKPAGSVSDDNGRLLPRDFAIRLVDAPPGVSDLLCQFEPGASYAASGNGRRSCVVAALQANSPITVRVGVAAMAWEMLEDIAVEKLPAEAQCWPGVVEAPIAAADGVALSTTIVNLPSNVRLVLMDRAGKSHTPNGYSSTNNDKLAPWGGCVSARMTFRGLGLQDVRSIRLQTRHEEYAAFANVPLQPK